MTTNADALAPFKAVRTALEKIKTVPEAVAFADKAAAADLLATIDGRARA